MSDLKLWFSPGACSLAPHVLLHEVGVPFEAVTVRVSEGAQLTLGFAQLNPKKRVPVLSIDGEVITEVPAIALAIAALSPEMHLMGRTSLERVRVSEWMTWLSGALHGQGFGALWRPERFSDDPGAFDGIRAKGRKTISDGFAYVEGKLWGAFATGHAFTAVDPYLLVFYRWGNGIGLDMASTYPRYAALASRLVTRASVAAALGAEHLEGQPLTDSPPTAIDGIPMETTAATGSLT